MSLPSSSSSPAAGSRFSAFSPAAAGIELSVVMPCLNEADTIGTCISKALAAFERHHIIGEIIVADNGSTDGSQAIAAALGARIVDVPARGYG